MPLWRLSLLELERFPLDSSGSVPSSQGSLVFWQVDVHTHSSRFCQRDCHSDSLDRLLHAADCCRLWARSQARWANVHLHCSLCSPHFCGFHPLTCTGRSFVMAIICCVALYNCLRAITAPPSKQLMFVTSGPNPPRWQLLSPWFGCHSSDC